MTGPTTVAVAGLTSSSASGAAAVVADNLNISVAGRASQSSYGTATASTAAAAVPVGGHTSFSAFGGPDPEILFSPRVYVYRMPVPDIQVDRTI